VIRFPVMLDDRLWFPDPRLAPQAGPESGLVAIGGDLSPARLLLAYKSGIFPWTERPLTWWSPDPRGIIDLAAFHAPRSLQRIVRRGCFKVTTDRAFRSVIEGCAAPAKGRVTTWITSGFVEAYTRLHEAGHAHSVECWQGDSLAGGIYGVAIGGFFAGESMFHRAANASKVALWSLVRRLGEGGFTLFDIQMITPITEQLGGVAVPREDYLCRLNEAIHLERQF
jgi:leucyl/phenylalanyl-tRNA---protein transferase